MISKLTNFIQLLNQDKQSSNRKLEILANFCKDARIDSKIKIKLVNAMEHSIKNKNSKFFDKQQLFAELPMELKIQVGI